jgi:hypothetical protein
MILEPRVCFSKRMFFFRIVRPVNKLFKREKSVSSTCEYRDRSLYKYFIDIQTR